MIRRVAITGAGVVSAIGATAAGTWRGLVEGRVGIGPLTLFDASGHRTGTAAQIRDPPPDRILPEGLLARRDRRRASRADLLGLRAALEAIGGSGIDAGGFDLRRAGLFLGGGGALLEGEIYYEAALHGPPPRPSTALGFFPSATADAIAEHLGFGGEVQTILTACSSATLALGLGASRVASGDLDVVLAGGVETLSRTTCAGFNALRLVDPGPCRPFDRERRGLSLGECAALLLLEDLEAARGRGARILAEVAGFGLAADAHHMTAPDPDGEGIARAMRVALQAAGIDPERVDHVNAHGTGTAQNDRAETRAIKRIFGGRSREIPVVSIKGMVGHCLGAAGAIEAFATAMAIHEGVVPPTAGLTIPDPECDLDYVPGRARRARVRIALSNSLAFGGNDGVLVLKDPAA